MALGIAAITFTQSAQAGRRHNNFAAGVAGFVLGSVISGAFAGPRRGYADPYYGDGDLYRAPPRRYYRRHYERPYYRTHYSRDRNVSRKRVYRGRPRVWSASWYRYCAKKYRSFNAANGTFQPYKGGRRLCR